MNLLFSICQAETKEIVVFNGHCVEFFATNRSMSRHEIYQNRLYSSLGLFKSIFEEIDVSKVVSVVRKNDEIASYCMLTQGGSIVGTVIDQSPPRRALGIIGAWTRPVSRREGLATVAIMGLAKGLLAHRITSDSLYSIFGQAPILHMARDAFEENVDINMFGTVSSLPLASSGEMITK